MPLVQKVIDSICSIEFKLPGELVNEISNCNAMVMVSRGNPGDKVRVERKIIELAQRGCNRPIHCCPCTRGCNRSTCRCYGTTGCLHGMTCSRCSAFPGGLEPLASFLTRSLILALRSRLARFREAMGNRPM